MTVDPRTVYPRLEVVRSMHVDPETGLVPEGAPWTDYVALVLRDGRIETGQACTLPTYREQLSPPVIVPQWAPHAMCVGIHQGRRAVVNQGTIALAYRRHDGRRGGGNTVDYRGLNIHDPRGGSTGCIQVPAVISRALAGALGQADRRLGPLHPDWRTPMVGIWVRQAGAR